MTKRFGLVILGLILALTAGCAGRGNGPEAANLEQVYQAMEKAAVLPPMVSVPEDLVLSYYGIEPAWCEQAVFRVASDSLLADEVVLIRAKDSAAAGKILPLLEARLQGKAEEAESYSPEQYAIVKQGHLLSEGRELALIVSPGAARLVQIYKGR